MPNPTFGSRAHYGVGSIHHIRNKELSPINQFQDDNNVAATPYFHSGAERKKTLTTESEQKVSRVQQTKHQLINLPSCDVKSIIDHIYTRGIYREEDLHVLKARLCHAYGK